MFILAKAGTHGTVYYPAADTGRAGWADDPRDACHYATRELAEEVIENLRRGGGVSVEGLRPIPDPLPEAERFRAVDGEAAVTTDPAETDPAHAVVGHLTLRPGVDAAFVMQDGRVDPIVERLLAQGWTVEGTEVVGGKRVRYLAAPPDAKEEQ